MKTHVQLALTAVLLSVPLLAGEMYLPLATGNSWTYRERGGRDTFTIRVGTPIVTADAVYYRVSGYTPEYLWVRADAGGELYFRDEEAGRELLLTSFAPAGGGWFQAPFRGCDQEGQTQEGRQEWQGPSGYFPSTLAIKYRSFNCADTGVQEERYAANIGMLERTVATIAGPRTYELVSARIGYMELRTGPRGNFNVSLRLDSSASMAMAKLELRTEDAVRLKDLAVSEVDALLRGADGAVLWQWSDGKVDAPAMRDVDAMFRTWMVEVPLTSADGTALPAGRYQVEAWVNSGEKRPQFAATAPLVIVRD